MLEKALVVVAHAKLCKKMALGHLDWVILMQELAVVALLAKAAQPVLADDLLAGTSVAKGAEASAGAFAGPEQSAHLLARLCQAMRR